MDAALLTPSKYIKAIGFKGRDVTVTMTGIKLEEMEREDGSTETKGLISIAETRKRWIVNVTNCKCLIAMFGRETDAWIGKRVTLFPQPNEMSESGFAIRVRGSPDLQADVAFTLKLARKKPKRMVLKAIAKNGNGKAAVPAQETLADDDDDPPHDPETGEVHEPGSDDGDESLPAAE